MAQTPEVGKGWAMGCWGWLCCSPTPALASPQGWQPLHSHRGARAGGWQAPALGPQDPGVPRGHHAPPQAVRTGTELCSPPQHSPVPAVGQGIPFLEVKQQGHPSGSPWLGTKGVSPFLGDRGLGRCVASPSLGSCGVEPSPGVSFPMCRECREPGAVCLPWIVERLLEGNSLTFLLLCVSLPGSPWDWDTLWVPLS